MWTQEKFNFEPRKKKPFWKRMSINFIERYFYLVCFATYAKAAAKRGSFKLIKSVYRIQWACEMLIAHCCFLYFTVIIIVTRLGYFLKVLATNFLTKVVQLYVVHSSKNYSGYFWAYFRKIGQLLIASSGHADYYTHELSSRRRWTTWSTDAAMLTIWYYVNSHKDVSHNVWLLFISSLFCTGIWSIPCT